MIASGFHLPWWVEAILWFASNAYWLIALGIVAIAGGAWWRRRK